ncbi:MAG: LysR family transcriptional regulator [Candidatus Obscuribacterales bacterium]|nr:LysR family transcriptional regulator [Steroidobacteraceae bacterium]
MRFDFKDLELFVAVAEAGSIARAAERCHTVASAVSKRLSDLEESFGTALLTRGARGVELTSAGHAFLIKARKLLAQASQLDDEIEKHSAGMRGQVRVFANMSAIVEFLPAMLASFLKQHPDIHVHLEQHLSEHIATAVKENIADLGIVGELPTLDGLTTMPFRRDELVLVTRRDDAAAGLSEVAFAEIAGLPFVGLDANSSLHYVLARAAADCGKRLDLRIRVASFDAACAMVAAGLGVTILPRLAIAPYVQAFDLASIKLTDAWAVRQLFVCVRADHALHPAATLLLEHLR